MIQTGISPPWLFPVEASRSKQWSYRWDAIFFQTTHGDGHGLFCRKNHPTWGDLRHFRETSRKNRYYIGGLPVFVRVYAVKDQDLRMFSETSKTWTIEILDYSNLGCLRCLPHSLQNQLSQMHGICLEKMLTTSCKNECAAYLRLVVHNGAHLDINIYIYI